MSGQYKYFLLVLILCAIFGCWDARGDENTKLHIGGSMLGTLAVYEFVNLMGRAGCHETQTQKCENKKEFLLLAAPLLFTTGLLIEATQAQERGESLDAGDIGANALGVGLAVGATFAFDL